MDLSSRRRSNRELSGRGESVAMMWQRVRRARAEERSARALHAAEHAAAAAAERYRALRSAATEGVGPSTGAEGGGAPRGPMPTWQQLLLLIVGGGLLSGLLVIWLLAAAYVGPAAMLVLPTIAGLVAGFVVLRRRHPPAPKPLRHRPSVADLVRATQELHDAEAALQRVRSGHDGSGEVSAPAPEPPQAPVPRPARPPWPAPGAPQT
ncbi:hypothetical protein ACU61A_31185 [Pseudonocardia sichuanensis]|uniref:Uncharacterized protein n=1 Tax=Pseudonocardia kunmingensis TaxID=630975 RepID=A0A543DIL8_9PSEU|nr:hypothetical protein [Pseudonocardia kunmingensis]TQM09187.1 hypothetical protein FB558_4937 [Pseudonocardia kunmingensis]